MMKRFLTLIVVLLGIMLISCGESGIYDMSNFDKTIKGKWKIEMKIFKGNNDQLMKEINDENYQTIFGTANMNEDNTYTLTIKGDDEKKYSAKGKFSVEASAVTFTPTEEIINDKKTKKPKAAIYAFVEENKKLKSASTDMYGKLIYTFWEPVK